MPIALLDTTLLSNFAQVRQPDPLRAALGLEVATIPAVLGELRAGESLELVPACDWSWLQVPEPTDDERRTAFELARQLDPGEAECLAVALSRNCRFLSDDFAARRTAELKGLTVSGTLGVLVRLVEAGQLSLAEADESLAQMIDQGYRSPVRSLESLQADSRG